MRSASGSRGLTRCQGVNGLGGGAHEPGRRLPGGVQSCSTNGLTRCGGLGPVLSSAPACEPEELPAQALADPTHLLVHHVDRTARSLHGDDLGAVAGGALGHGLAAWRGEKSRTTAIYCGLNGRELAMLPAPRRDRDGEFRASPGSGPWSDRGDSSSAMLVTVVLGLPEEEHV